MQSESNKIRGRIAVAAAVILVLVALGLYLYSNRAGPPETQFETPSAAEPLSEPLRSGSSDASAMPDDSAATAEAGPGDTAPASRAGKSASGESAIAGPSLMTDVLPEPEISLDRQQQELREDLAARLGPGQVEMIVDERLLERLVTTVNSLDGAPVPLRFRPLAHVPDLPRLERAGENWRLPETPDPRYRPYRALFDRLDVVEQAELFDRYEPALEKAWQSLGEQSGQPFRARLIEILEHLAEFEPPSARPRLSQPEVLYEYIDPQLEQLSWGRKILLRIGPVHAPAVQRKLGALADALAQRDGQGSEN